MIRLLIDLLIDRLALESQPSLSGPTLSGDNSEASTFTCQICTAATLEYAKDRALKAESHGKHQSVGEKNAAKLSRRKQQSCTGRAGMCQR